ncbi:MAG: flagellar biosynthesis protein FlhB [Planctomycetes bacterium]|jgi:flagellar biosynthetic protein FlhB|nr:flagellar biosynthesis protein FlhB [Planctomycetota bacterium]
MADSGAQDKTEQPTPHRLRKARREGQVAQSQEVPSAIMTAMFLLMLTTLGGTILHWAQNTVVLSIAAVGHGVGDGETVRDAFRVHGLAMGKVVAPFLIAFVVAGIAGSVVVGGLNFTTKAVKFDWGAISPVKGVKQMVSLQSLMKLLMAILKLIMMITICYLYLRNRRDALLELRWGSPAEIIERVAWLIFGLLLRIVIALLVIAAIDLIYQKWQYKRKLRMSKQEVKEEHKQHEGSPEMRSRIRQTQMQMVQRRMFQDVPDADVVITNPTHVAVALKYDPGEMDAPLVVAKGPDELAMKIREIAKAHDVPIIERPPLARTLYASVEIGQPVPEDLFVAVAEVLAMIYRMRRKRRAAQV